ncbi:MAG: hypothetical protein HN742_26020 [Lentisphaerae bacterium]|nr:hypothetical protein [Lentisphaerota bacterium]MBT4816363.1 hypothetical protein [Lentisphaerota bacterium]MBT5605579.1 hypothetical protein [Lentisphaerota bacterium]MBT7056856.1 hypothetical protein [Lentisphaerota bacterium]MBT7845358.1 hypothetical protein [Lentisphaerota bacterium]
MRQRLGWLASAVALVWSLVLHGQQLTTELVFAEGRGVCVAEGKAALGLSLLRQAGADVVHLEAEAAEALSFQEGKGPTMDTAASGGAYVAHVTHAEFPFAVKQAGQYQGWARFYLPWAGSWNHQESMDKGGKRQINDSVRWVFGEWIWGRLGEYKLRAGEHRFILHNWLGGARLDSIFFTTAPGFSAEALIGSPLPDDESGSGTVTTAPMHPSQVDKWLTLDWEAELNGGTVNASVSSDGGQSWTNVGPGGDLSGIRPAADGTDVLLARFSLRPAGNGRSPRVSAPKVTFELSPDAEVIVGNAQYGIAFSRKTGMLCGIRNRATSTVVTQPHIQQPLLALAVRPPGGTTQTVISQQDLSFRGVEEGASGCALRYTAIDGKIGLRVELSHDDTPLCRVRQDVVNNSDQEIIRLDFPLLGNAAIGLPSDDELVFPQTGGVRVRNPAADKRHKRTYLGGGSMAWLDLCDERSGLFMMITDKRLTTTEMECAPAAGRTGVDLAFRTHTLIRPGERRTREYRIGVHPGDWHWGADRYREWAYSWMKRPDNPEWLKWCDGWVHGSGNLTFGSIRKMTRRMQNEGWEYLQYWGQMADGIDQCCGNFYWPAPALGGADGLTRGVAAAQELGGRVTAYMNCQTWTRDSWKNDSLRLTPKSELPQEALELVRPLAWFEECRLYPLDGKPQGYYAQKYGWYIMCPASVAFREHLRFWIVDMYCKRFGLDGVYLDQAGATLAKPCYNLEHGHSDVGDWGGGNAKLLEQVMAEAREVNPEFIMAIEGAGDALGQYANLHLTSGLCTDPEVYHYTFPDHILISGYSNSSKLSRQQRVAQAHLNGDRFDAFVGDVPALAALQLRQRIKQWLYPGRFMDTVGLSVSDPQVRARWTLCDQERERAIVFTFDNEFGVEGATCTLRLPSGWEQPRWLHLYSVNGWGAAASPTGKDGCVVVSIPKGRISAALLMYRTQPEHQLDVWQELKGGDHSVDTVVVRAANYSDAAIVAELDVRVDSPLVLDSSKVTVEIAAGGLSVRELRLSGVGELLVPGDVAARVSWPGGNRLQIAQVRPLLSNPGLDIDEDGDSVPDFWALGGTSATFAHGVADGAVWMQGREKHYQYIIQHVPLAPDRTYYFAGRIKRSAQTKSVSIAVVEFVGKGYRVHAMGGDAALPANEWQRFEQTFTTGSSLDKAAVYLYNTHTEVKAWYDDLELRPVE